MNRRVAIILVNCLDYAQKFLDDCAKSLRQQDYQGEMKIFMVDNGSGSADYLLKTIPEAEFVFNKTNDGFAKGNNDGIRQALMQNFDYIILFNLDMIIESDCVRRLVETAEKKEVDSRLRGNDKREIGAVQARIMLWPEKDKINSIGNITHFLGFGYSEGYNEKFPISNLAYWQAGSQFPIKEICYPSGAGVLFRADVLKKIGLFDEEMWMYNEDQDLGWRVWLAGYKCVLAPDAVAYHKYEFSRSISKYYWMDRNRIIVMLKNYRLGTLILIFPAFIVMEFGLVLFAIKGGRMKEKMKVWKYFFSVKDWRYILRARQQTQSLRKVRDHDIVAMFSGKIWYQEIDDIKLRLVNPVFSVYWWLVKKIIWW